MATFLFLCAHVYTWCVYTAHIPTNASVIYYKCLGSPWTNQNKHLYTILRASCCLWHSFLFSFFLGEIITDSQKMAKIAQRGTMYPSHRPSLWLWRIWFSSHTTFNYYTILVRTESSPKLLTHIPKGNTFTN